MNTRSLVVVRVAVAGLAAVAMSVATGAAGMAHSQLIGSDPEPGSTVEAPTQVLLTFNEELIQVGSQISVVDAQGVASELEVQYPEPHIVAADLPDLASGPVAITWRVVSADGHPLEGVIEFEVTVPLDPSPTPSEEPSPQPPLPSPTEPSASATPISVPMPQPGGGVPPWLWVALAVAVAGASAIAVFSARKR